MKLAHRIAAVVSAGCLVAGSTAFAAEPLSFLTSPEKVTLSEDGANRVWYRVTAGKPLRILAGEPMQLILTARPVVAASGDPTVTLAVTGGKSVTLALPSAGSAPLPGPGGLQVGANRQARVIVDAPKRVVTISVDRGAALVVFGRAPVAIQPAPAATPAPLLDASPAPAFAPIGIPLIPRQVERLSLVPKVGAVMPLGAVDPPAAGSIDNLYLGAELRYALPVLERRLSLSADIGTYRVHDTEAIVGTTPFRASVDDEVDVGWRVTPVLAGALYRLAGSKRTSLYAGAAAGAAAISREETVDVRAPRTTRETAPAAQARLGVEQRAGPGRIVIEVSYLHVMNDADREPYLGGPLGGVHYRFAF